MIGMAPSHSVRCSRRTARQRVLYACACAGGLAFASLQAGTVAPAVPLQPGVMYGLSQQIRGAPLPNYVAYFRVGQVSPAQLVLEGFRRVRDPQHPGQHRIARFHRVVRGEDLRSALRLSPQMITDDPPMFPGYTAFQASSGLLARLQRGETVAPFVFAMTPGSGVSSGHPDVLGGLAGAFKGVPQLGGALAALSPEYTRTYYRGSLRRVEVGTVPVTVLLNGTPTALPTLHARAALRAGGDGGVADFWFLDDPADALLLRWSFQGRSVEIVRIDAPVSGTGATARMLAKLASTGAGQGPGAAGAGGAHGAQCHVELHGVYFDTASADLLPASDATLTAVAQVIKTHPDWVLTVEGHTDNVGTAAYNMDLSKRRAQAVRAALVQRFGVRPDRLAAQGFGFTRPIDTNTTAVGRAHNRRVELARACR